MSMRRNRNGQQNKISPLSAAALAKAVDLGAVKPKRVKIQYQCTECQTRLKTSHIVPESKVAKELTGLLVPCICTTCLEKKIAGESPTEA